MNRSAVCCFVFIAVLAGAGCGPYSSVYPEGDFHIMVISDVHISRDETKDRRLSELIENINTETYPGLRALMITGDCVSKVYSTKKQGQHLESSNNLAKLVTLLKPLSVPCFMAMGNHDYKIDGDKDSDAPFTQQEIEDMEAVWLHHTGFEPYYSVVYHGWKFILLNSMRGRYLERAFDPVQLDWLEDQLAGEQPVLLFFHHPIETDHFHFWGKFGDLITEENEPRFFGMAARNADKIKGIFVGHGHSWIEGTLFEKIPVFETDSFGESDGLPFYIVGIDTVQGRINTARSPIKFSQETR